MKSNALSYFKKNIDINLNRYIEDEDNKWLFESYKEFSGEESPFEEFKFEVPEFSLEMPEKYSGKTDCENAKILYTALKKLTPTQAKDERFWSGLAHSNLYAFSRYRSGLPTKELSEQKVLVHFYFGHSKRRSLFTNQLSRLWWVAYLIYDEENTKNHFEGLEFFENDFSGKALTMFSSTFTSNPNITRAILKGILDIQKELDKNISIDQFREILRYINILGSRILLDYLGEEELKEKVKQHFYKVNF